jgi:hypothetical protein
VAWDIEYTDEFGAWWEGLDEGTQIAIDASVRLLETKGPQLPFPHSSDMRGSRFGQMRELRIQHKGEPYRILYAFDPRRTAILLIGGNKGGNDRWYREYVPQADRLYEEHLATLAKEGLIHGKKV